MCDVCVCVDVLGVDSVYVVFVYLGCGLCVCVMLCVFVYFAECSLCVQHGMLSTD